MPVRRRNVWIVLAAAVGAAGGWVLFAGDLDGRAIPLRAVDQAPGRAAIAAAGPTVGEVSADLPPPAEPEPSLPVTLRRLFEAIREVESGHDDLAVGGRGHSKGPYQITRAYWRDGCRYGGVNWSYDRCVWSRPHCEAVMRWYWARWGARTLEECARMHNGGPRGHEKPATRRYWQRVRAVAGL